MLRRLRRLLTHWAMRWVAKCYPRSILQLMVAGFAVVLIPLAAALLTSVLYVDHLSSQSRHTVVQVAEAVRNSRMLLQQVNDMERNARVYQVVDKPSFLKAYRSRRAAFMRTTSTLARLDRGHHAAVDLLGKLTAREQALHQALASAAVGSKQARQALHQFADLNALVRGLMVENSVLVEHTTADMRAAATQARYWLFWEAMAAVPLAILLCALVVTLLVRPLRRLERSIRRLGTGDFSYPVVVRGPRDLVELGDRLEWMRNRFRELEAQKLNFVRHVSHELKTPLASMREGVGLLSDSVVGPLNPEQRDVTRILEQSTRTLQTRIEDLLTFGTSQSESRLQHREPVAFDKVVSAVVEEQHLPAQARHLRIEVQVEPLTVNGDPDQLRVIVDNLLSNAIKYSPDSGCIWVRLERDGNRAQLSVRDEGPGIEASDSERIFEPFYQGSASYRGHIKGSGLGLSIVQQYVRLHRGAIRVEPAQQGAHLTVRLPLNEES